MTISVPVQGYANSPTVGTGDNLKMIVIGVVAIAVVVGIVIIFKK